LVLTPQTSVNDYEESKIPDPPIVTPSDIDSKDLRTVMSNGNEALK
jgi:ubiquitin carboxyl-terminal hydrolase 47